MKEARGIKRWMRYRLSVPCVGRSLCAKYVGMTMREICVWKWSIKMFRCKMWPVKKRLKHRGKKLSAYRDNFGETILAICGSGIPCYALFIMLFLLQGVLTTCSTNLQLPRTNKQCPKCDSTEAVFFQSQQRTAETGMVCCFRNCEVSARTDLAQALYFVCSSCGEVWKNA